MAKGEDTGSHPGRQVGRTSYLGGIQNKNGFVGTFHGSDNGRGYFSSESTGGGSTDSRSIPWQGPTHAKGQKFAMIPNSDKRGPGFPGHNAGDSELSDWSAHVYDPERHGHLPGGS